MMTEILTDHDLLTDDNILSGDSLYTDDNVMYDDFVSYHDKVGTLLTSVNTDDNTGEVNQIVPTVIQFLIIAADLTGFTYRRKRNNRGYKSIKEKGIIMILLKS
jgi:hypothetical protein